MVGADGESEFEPVKLGFWDKTFIAKGVAKYGGPRSARRRYSSTGDHAPHAEGTLVRGTTLRTQKVQWYGGPRSARRRYSSTGEVDSLKQEKT